MQLVSAFSRPETVPAVPIRAPNKNIWILGSWRDLILYVGTPLLLIPMFALAQKRWSAQDIYIFVAAFGAMGHHLPGMIRAYGDPALFERFKWRFIFAPIFLLTVCVAFTWWDLKGIVLVVFFWGVWHGMMQTYGFCRIYDAKMGSFAALTRRLDLATCAIWFAAAVLLSSSRMTDTLRAYYASGAPVIPPWFLHGLQQGVLFSAIAISILFLLNFSRMWIQGKRPNPVKLALLGTSISFWWFCNNWVTNILAGIALFEVFHDVQYLSLVWIYNRNRVEKDSSIGGFMRFVFRRSGSLVGLYIGLVFAYGSLGYFAERIDIDTIKRVLIGIVAASGLLHFYYDGFIWKVRERSTRESLGLTGGTAAIASGRIFPSWFLHGAKWVAVFVIPLAALWVGQAHGPAPTLQRAAWIVSDIPHGAMPHFDYAAALKDAGRLDEAAQQLRIGLNYSPNDEKGHYTLANILLHQAKPAEAITHLEEVLRREPQNGDFHADYGYALELGGRKKEALAQYQQALQLSPNSTLAHYNYAMFLTRAGNPVEAKIELEKALALKPDYADAHYDLGNLLYQKGDWEGARTHYLASARVAPKRVAVHNMLGIVFLRQGLTSQALLQFAEALELDPNDPYAAENLRRAQAMDASFGPRTSLPR
ncbi:MAG: tetratricopeptide repeat protein [Chthoniobacterales bacterium]|nr:tetratricopeptide repeat protein [Chthoniobacterales bacterium]